MKKLLRPRDILLLGVGGILDIFEEIKDPIGIMAKSYENMYGFIPRQYKKHNYSHLIWRTLKTGYIEKVLKGKEVYLRLTSEGKKKIRRDFPLLSFQKSKWDRKWRLVLFDIAELNRRTRNALRRKLRELGFGMFQQSAYMSPHNFTKDMLEFLDAVGLSDFVYVFEIPHNQMTVGDTRGLANKLWNLDSINERYKELIGEISHLIGIDGRPIKLNSQEVREERKIKKEKRTKKSREEIRKGIYEEYFKMIIVDPFLPKELLPQDWAFTKLTAMIGKL